MFPRSRVVIGTITVLTLFGAACGPGKDSGNADSKSDGGVSAKDLPPCPVDAFKKASGPTEVVFWDSYVGRTSAALKKIVDSYNSSQDKVKVRLENQGVTYDELRKSYEAAAAAKQLPALVAGEDTWTQYMIDAGTTLPASACMAVDKDERAQIDDLLPGIKAAYSVADVQWPAAFGASTVVLYYNRNHFTAAGLDPEKPPTNLDELRSAAEALAKVAAPKGPSGQPFAMKLDPWFIENMVSGQDQTLVNNDNGRNGKRADASTLKSPDLDTALTWLAGMKTDGLLNAIPSTTLIDHYIAVATEKSSMLIETSTSATLIDQVTSSKDGLKLGDVVDPETAKEFAAFNGFKVKFKVGVAEVPGIELKGKGQAGGSAMFMTNTGSDEVQSAAWDFMKYFMQVDNQVIWTNEGSYLPVRSSVEEKLNADPAWKESQRGQWISTAYKSVQTLSEDFPGPLIGPYDKFRESLRSLLETIALGKEAGDVGPAVDKAVTEIDAALEKYNATNK